MTSRSEVASAIEAARRRREPAIDPPASLFDIPPPAQGFTHKGAGASETDAAERALHNATSWKGRVWRCIRDAGVNGATVFEIHHALGGTEAVDFNTIQPRIPDLADDGLIVIQESHGQRTTIDEATGRSYSGFVWVASEHRLETE